MKFFLELSQTICNKTDNTRAFLQQNLKQCPSCVRERCYFTLVRPILEYTCIIWSPYTLSNIDRLEKIQRKSVRFVCNDFSMYSSVTHMLNTKHWSTLKSRRDNLRLAMMYKIINNLVEVETKNSLIRNGLPTRGHSCRFKQPFTNLLSSYNQIVE